MDYNQNELVKLATQSMPHGKYKGRLFIDLPENYVIWCYNNCLPQGELGNLLGLLYEIKINGLEYLVQKLKS